jgi:prenyltransferase beta subunit
VAVLALTALVAINVRAQSAADFAQTAAYAAAQQNADGDFAASPGQPSTLGATNTGLRVLDYVGGSLLDEPGCIRFVNSCKVPGSGFAQRPGGKPDVVTTAVGLMAAAELKIAGKAMIDDAVAYFGANARAFEEVRMSIAGLEAVGARSPDFARWAEQLESLRTPDGSFGQHPGKAGRRPDGAWSKDDGPSDLSSSYRVMRALYMLKEKPDVERLTGYIARCRHADGSYSSTPEGPGNLGATYFATIILRWLRLLDGKPPVLETAAFAPLFDNMDLAGWEGNTALWSARDRMLVGKSPGLDHNEFLATRQPYRDFILSLRFHLVDGNGNSGVQFRSVRVPGTEMSG